MKNKDYKIVITGVGGQGIITLARVLARAASLDGYQVKVTEVHGLAQRGGHVWCHVTFGKKVFSPLVPKAEANCLISLEPLETLRQVSYLNKKTKVFFNQEKVLPISMATDKKPYPSLKKITQQLKTISPQVRSVDATHEVYELTGETTAVNIFMLGLAWANQGLPLSEKSILASLKSVIKPQYFSVNQKIFKFAQK